jgi:hypothetical protein
MDAVNIMNKLYQHACSCLAGKVMLWPLHLIMLHQSLYNFLPEKLFPGIDMSCNNSFVFRLSAEITKPGSYIYSFITNYRVFSAEE